MSTLPGSISCSRGSSLKFYTYTHPDGNRYHTSAQNEAEAIKTFKEMVADAQQARERFREWVIQNPQTGILEAVPA